MVKLKSGIIILFLSYLVFQPVLPFIEYFTFKQYIIENLCVNRNTARSSCCQGKCYLEKKIKETNNDEDNDAQAPSNKRTEIYPYVIPTKGDVNSRYAVQVQYTNYINKPYYFLYSQSIFRPPIPSFLDFM